MWVIIWTASPSIETLLQYQNRHYNFWCGREETESPLAGN
jgi:hypothetical protein